MKLEKPKKINNTMPGRFYFFLSNAHRGLREGKQRTLPEKFSKFILSTPKFKKQNSILDETLWNLGKPTAGAKYFKEVAKGNPSSERTIKALFFLGKIYEEQKNYPRLLKTLSNGFE
ncbi:MAG: hypothetical protein Ct9H300mP23_10100 [Nitrospinota bacterium]|nr:MAG: hypothetical protein Ct9H300mP23_10100 [Nitrospinota bacterium]